MCFSCFLNLPERQRGGQNVRHIQGSPKNDLKQNRTAISLQVGNALPSKIKYAPCVSDLLSLNHPDGKSPICHLAIRRIPKRPAYHGPLFNVRPVTIPAPWPVPLRGLPSRAVSYAHGNDAPVRARRRDACGFPPDAPVPPASAPAWERQICR